MSSASITRSAFIAATGTAAANFCLAAPAFANPPTLIRRDVGGLSATGRTIASYRKAIVKMKALPATDPRSWSYQAAIHGTMASPNLTAWNTCEHWTDYFWSWHRMYLYWFERIVRYMSGDPKWALPYWNWRSPSERQLPAMFRDTSSELYVANRNTWMNNGSGSLPTTDVLYDDAFAYIDYPSANDTIQGTPHSSVHVDVGGWMGVVETAAQDPIFYLHHCNIDRLWNLWLAQHGGRADPVADSTWTGKVSTFFDEHGHEVQMRPCEVLRAAQQLRYAYENEPAQVNDYCQPPHIRIPHYAETTLLHIPPPPENLGARPVTFPLFKTATLRERLLAIMKNTSSTLLLRFDNIVAEEQPGVTWDVFVGLPHGAAPDPNGPFYVGNLALFGSGIRSSVHSGRKFVPATFRYRVGRALLESIRRNEATVTATFVPHGVLVDGKLSHPAPRSTVRIGSATLLVRRERAH